MYGRMMPCRRYKPAEELINVKADLSAETMIRIANHPNTKKKRKPWVDLWTDWVRFGRDGGTIRVFDAIDLNRNKT